MVGFAYRSHDLFYVKELNVFAWSDCHITDNAAYGECAEQGRQAGGHNGKLGNIETLRG